MVKITVSKQNRTQDFFFPLGPLLSLSKLFKICNLIFYNFLNYFLKCLFILEHEWWRGRERERERESKAGSALSAEILMWGSNPQTLRSRPEPKLDTQLTKPSTLPNNLIVIDKMEIITVILQEENCEE